MTTEGPRVARRRTPGWVRWVALLVALIMLAGAAFAIWSVFVRPAEQLDKCRALTTTDSATASPIVAPTSTVTPAPSVSLDAEQARNAAIIAGVGMKRNLPVRAVVVALATAYQESKLRNIAYGDRDSLGLFQQRPSQDWGTPEQVMDPYYATNAFYNALVRLKTWQKMDVNDAAQAVQRSGFPTAYRQHVANATTLAMALTGQAEGAFSCAVKDPRQGDPGAAQTWLTKTLGSDVTGTVSGRTVTFTAPDQAKAWQWAQLAVANAGGFGLESVQVGKRTWTMDSYKIADWSAGNESTTVVVTFRP